MTQYIPSPSTWVAEQVELYEKSNGGKGNTIAGFPVVIVTNTGRRTGAVRKTPLIRVKDGNNYILIASQGGSPNNPHWYYNLKASSAVKIQDCSLVYEMKVTEIFNSEQRNRLWKIAVKTYHPYEDYQNKTTRLIPIFLAKPIK
ncbi:uncharacterized protein METZ01_LOCUS238994 [marine metagenome]|uniref:Nitroreductase domain-containing protein n=1 Tax=marine metagenome TaxID=408172 RepID=A0A382HFR8_9ZZZZ